MTIHTFGFLAVIDAEGETPGDSLDAIDEAANGKLAPRSNHHHRRTMVGQSSILFGVRRVSLNGLSWHECVNIHCLGSYFHEYGQITRWKRHSRETGDKMNSIKALTGQEVQAGDP